MDAVIKRVKVLFDANTDLDAAGIVLKTERTGDDLPYAIVDNITDPLETRTNKSRYYDTTFQLSVRDTTAAAVILYKGYIETALNDVDLALATVDGKAMLMSILDAEIEQEDTEVWVYRAQFEVKRQKVK